MAHFKTIEYKAGQTVFREGEQGDCGYIILSGSMQVHKKVDGREVSLAILAENQVFGEMALVSPGHRTASVTALKDSTVLHIHQSQFMLRRNQLDPVMKMVFDIILARFRNTLASLGKGDAEVPAPAPLVFTKTREALSQLQLEADIRRGLAAKEFDLNYQPIVCLQSGKLVGFEGLMRWTHPSGEFISPETFISLAAASNLMPRFSRLALRRACAALQTLSEAALHNLDGTNPLFMTVNVCAGDLASQNFYKFLEQCLERHAIGKDMLKLEVTETSLMDDIGAIVAKFSKLEQLGVQLAIDDFGTGYSSMAYLAKLPASTLKIDRSFICDMLESDAIRKVTIGILRLADELGLDTVAEGVETQAHWDFLGAENCRYGQGYLYSKALPLGDAAELVRTWNSSTGISQEPIKASA